MLLLHGTEDAWVPFEQAVLMADALNRNGVPHRLIKVDGARHGFEASVDERRDYLPEIFAFLESVWNVSTGAPAGGGNMIRNLFSQETRGSDALATRSIDLQAH